MLNLDWEGATMSGEKAALDARWPHLVTPGWRETSDTIQLWTQIGGKTRLRLVPPINHTWNCTLYLSARGLTTGPMPFRDLDFEVEFDLVDDRLLIRPSQGRTQSLPLQGQSVASFYRQYLAALETIGVHLELNAVPNELASPIPFNEDDSHCTYDPVWAKAFGRALLSAGRVMTEFRSGYLGKVSPVHFFWGAFDLAVTRFSGRTAPLHPGGVPHLPDYVVRDAYSHEVSSAGFWPGNDAYPEAAFYSYAYPEPPGFSDLQVHSDGAFYHPTLREHLLPYEVVRRSPKPSQRVRAFFEATYRGAAELGKWDRSALEIASVDRDRRVRPSTNSPCRHLGQTPESRRWVPAQSDGCQECQALGSNWVELRLCTTCGHVGCCDDSRYRHATHHFHASGHPVIRSLERGEGWDYCYPDQLFAEGLDPLVDGPASEPGAHPFDA